jgi:hypothetical protein
MQFFSGIKDKISDYIDTKLKLYQLGIEERVYEIFSNMLYLFLLMGITLTGFGVLIALLIQIINSKTGNPFLGYLTMSGVCFVLILLLTREKARQLVTDSIKNKIISTIKTEQNGDEESDSI